MKLYELEEKMPIKIYIVEPMTVSDGSSYIICDHLDGAYSYCTTEKGGPNGDPLHLSANAPLEEHKDGFKLME